MTTAAFLNIYLQCYRNFHAEDAIWPTSLRNGKIIIDLLRNTSRVLPSNLVRISKSSWSIKGAAPEDKMMSCRWHARKIYWGYIFFLHNLLCLVSCPKSCRRITTSFRILMRPSCVILAIIFPLRGSHTLQKTNARAPPAQWHRVSKNNQSSAR